VGSSRTTTRHLQQASFFSVSHISHEPVKACQKPMSRQKPVKRAVSRQARPQAHQPSSPPTSSSAVRPIKPVSPSAPVSPRQASSAVRPSAVIQGHHPRASSRHHQPSKPVSRQARHKPVSRQARHKLVSPMSPVDRLSSAPFEPSTSLSRLLLARLLFFALSFLPPPIFVWFFCRWRKRLRTFFADRST